MDGDQPVEDSYLHTGQQENRVHEHRHQCFEWGSKPNVRAAEGSTSKVTVKKIVFESSGADNISRKCQKYIL